MIANLRKVKRVIGLSNDLNEDGMQVVKFAKMSITSSKMRPFTILLISHLVIGVLLVIITSIVRCVAVLCSQNPNYALVEPQTFVDRSNLGALDLSPVGHTPSYATQSCNFNYLLVPR